MVDAKGAVKKVPQKCSQCLLALATKIYRVGGAK